uniref:Uncharacterized protein n=1 Tax=Lynx canadensis TaxID=61383 RepID=A0A667FUM1_LYNCA
MLKPSWATQALRKPKASSMIQTIMWAAQTMSRCPGGPILSERGVFINQFCKKFNEKAKEEDIPLPTKSFVKPDRACEIKIG